MTSPLTRPSILVRSAAGLALLLACTTMTACSSSDDSGDADTAGSSSTPVPSQGSTANPFDAEVAGPDTAQPGDTITETLSNTGRLPDAYQIVVEPADAATLSESDFHLSPGESVRFKIRVAQTPFDLHLKSIGGGAPDVVALSVS